MAGVARRPHLTHTSLPSSACTPLSPWWTSLADIFWYARSTSLLLHYEASKEVLAILMGSFLSALSSIWLFSIHGVGILTSSAPPSANCSCRMHLFATFPIFDIGTPFHQSSVSSSLLVCHPTFFSSSFTRRSRMGSAALRLR